MLIGGAVSAPPCHVQSSAQTAGKSSAKSMAKSKAVALRLHRAAGIIFTRESFPKTLPGNANIRAFLEQLPAHFKQTFGTPLVTDGMVVGLGEFFKDVAWERIVACAPEWCRLSFGGQADYSGTVFTKLRYIAPAPGKSLEPMRQFFKRILEHTDVLPVARVLEMEEQ